RIISSDERAFHLHPAIRDWQKRLIARRAERDEASPEPSMAETLALGEALGRLIDEMAIEGVPLSRLATITPENFDASRFDDYWSLTREFLALAADVWPSELERLGAEDANAARLRIIADEARRLREAGTPHPVIIAGSTGSVRATAELMRVVSRFQNGAVILPGLDQALDHDDPDGAWALIGNEKASLPTRFAHPQASLKRTLDIIGIDRANVIALGVPDDAIAARNRLVSEALRPAETSERWQRTRLDFPTETALSGLTLIEAADEREEARAIAVLMRQTLETPASRAALVTADRGLANRVRHELKRFGIEAEDSAGIHLGESQHGMFVRLFLEVACQHNSAAMLAFLRHPSCGLGLEADELPFLADALEIFIGRQHRFPRTTPWAERARIAFARDPKPRWPCGQIFDAEKQVNLTRFCANLDDIFAPFFTANVASSLHELIEHLAEALEECRKGAQFETDEAARVDQILDDLARLGGEVKLTPRDLREVIGQALRRVILPPSGESRRAQIFGFLEARLIEADRVIIGGLNEGSVPPAVAGDPFLNRAMRLGLGLQPGERRIGQSAHDFSMLAGNPDLVLTRSERVGTSPGTPSRFLKRLEAFAGIELWKKHVREPGRAILAQIRQADDPGLRASIAPPFVVPARPRLPETISITDFEKLRRDPYDIYARKLLRLRALNPLDPEPDGRQRGTLLHRVLERFARERVEADPAMAGQRLRDIAAQEFRVLAHEP
ncbi:MAG: double-strand break repair protein AddB, partial [Rhabdaerophilum sp.]